MKLTDFWHSTRPLWQAPMEGAQGAAPVEPAAPEGPDLSFVPADFHVDGKPDLGKFSEHYTSLKAEADARAAKVVPEAYDFALPKDLKFEGIELPEGFAMEALTADPAFQPLYAELGGVLKEIGAPAEAAGKMAGLLAKYEAAKAARDFAAVKAEAATLGPQAQQRVENVQRLLQAKLPADQVKALQGITRSAAALQAVEALLGPKSMASPVPAPGPTASVDADLAAHYANPKR